MGDDHRRLSGLNDVHGHVIYGEPNEELSRLSGALDLLMVGSRSYGPVGRQFNGNTSRYLARRARCPLLVLPRGVTEDAELSAEQGAQAPIATQA
jgi:nucleotide-binding universal stress UspA family protein